MAGEEGRLVSTVTEGQDRQKGINKDATIRKRSRQACNEEENIEGVALLG